MPRFAWRIKGEGYQTLDLDCVDIVKLDRIKAKISALPCCKEIVVTDSALKGYHIKIWCWKSGCIICRLVFDHQDRLDHDLHRPNLMQNVLFDTKVFPSGTCMSHLIQNNAMKKYRKEQTALWHVPYEISEVRHDTAFPSKATDARAQPVANPSSSKTSEPILKCMETLEALNPPFTYPLLPHSRQTLRRYCRLCRKCYRRIK